MSECVRRQRKVLLRGNAVFTTGEARDDNTETDSNKPTSHCFPLTHAHIHTHTSLYTFHPKMSSYHSHMIMIGAVDGVVDDDDELGLEGTRRLHPLPSIKDNDV